MGCLFGLVWFWTGLPTTIHMLTRSCYLELHGDFGDRSYPVVCGMNITCQKMDPNIKNKEALKLPY